MPSTRELRRRISSTRSTRQITKALELVSAAKMRRASQAAIAGRPYSSRSWEAVSHIGGRSSELSHPLLNAVSKVERILVIAISSSRGLAGAYDSSIVKSCLQIVRAATANKQEVSFIAMGRKVANALASRKLEVVQSYPDLPEKPVSQDILPIAQYAIEAFLRGDYQQVRLEYTQFKSLMIQEATSIQLVPLIAPDATKAPTYQLSCEPDAETVLNHILPRIVETALYHALLESRASEHSARRMAMKNATDNANDMIDDLTLTYNGVRQGAITQELAEISGGAAALTS